MTSTTFHRDHPIEPADAASGLRQVFRIDAAVCGVTGLLLVAAARPLADLADVATTTVIVGAGAFLVVLAAGLALALRSTDRNLARLAPWSAAGDLGWVAVSLALTIGVPMSGWGIALLLAQAAVVAGIAAAKLLLRCSTGTTIIGAR